MDALIAAAKNIFAFMMGDIVLQILMIPIMLAIGGACIGLFGMLGGKRR